MLLRSNRKQFVDTAEKFKPVTILLATIDQGRVLRQHRGDGPMAQIPGGWNFVLQLGGADQRLTPASA